MQYPRLLSADTAVVAALALTISCATTSKEQPTPEVATPTSSSEPPQRQATERGNSDVIRVWRPRRGTNVSSPMQVRGEARGMWYFEATFPVRLLDAQGQVLIETYAQARSEWMTEAYVPFEVEFTFQPKPGESCTLVLEKANASGLPEHADELRIPLVFTPAPLPELD